MYLTQWPYLSPSLQYFITWYHSLCRPTSDLPVSQIGHLILLSISNLSSTRPLLHIISLLRKEHALLVQLQRLSKMNPSRPKLPRRHTQRQALRSARCQEYSQTRGPQIKNSNQDIDSAFDLEGDSGYGSYSNPEAEAEAEAEARYYDAMMDKFEEEEPTLSNPGDSTLDMMEIEKRNWQK
jgi:hypothetical protein